MKIAERVLLAEFTTLGVGGMADFFARVCSIQDAQDALVFACKKKLPIFVLGCGSNLLFSDAGFRGLVIKNEICGLSFFEKSVQVGSGIFLSDLIIKLAKRNLANLENFAGIPGTVGGAVVGNANNIGDNVISVVVLTTTGEIKTFSKEELRFAYRQSVLQKSNYFLVEVKFELMLSHENLLQKISTTVREKITKQPFKKTAGSWYKNPKKQKAWELINAVGCRGLRVGGATVSMQHANFFQNSGHATATDFLELEKKVSAKVLEKFKIQLEREVIVVPETSGASTFS